MTTFPFEERDWKYLQSIHDELLHELCSNINQQLVSLASSEEGTPHSRYLKTYEYIHEADKVVADCFNSWRRSNLGIIFLFLRKEKLLSDAQVKKLSAEAQEWLRQLEASR